MPDENSFDERAPRAVEWLLPFCTKEIAIVIRNSAIAAQNLTIESLPYKDESRGRLRMGEEANDFCMSHLP